MNMRYTKFFCFLFMMVVAVSAFSKQPKDKINMVSIWLAFRLPLRILWFILRMCSTWTVRQ